MRLSDGSFIRSVNVFWAAGIRPSPVVERISEEEATKKRGRLLVDHNLRVPGHPEVYVVGDAAWVEEGERGGVAPPTASAAVQEGAYVGEHLASLLGGRPLKEGFRYRDRGLMLSLGRFSGLVELPNGLILSGFLGWAVWRMVHLVSIATARNRLGVVFDWVFSLLHRRIMVRTD